jgi:hypothetical protein
LLDKFLSQQLFICHTHLTIGAILDHRVVLQAVQTVTQVHLQQDTTKALHTAHLARPIQAIDQIQAQAVTAQATVHPIQAHLVHLDVVEVVVVDMEAAAEAVLAADAEVDLEKAPSF